jgi:iron complex transport system permease protein
MVRRPLAVALVLLMLLLGVAGLGLLHLRTGRLELSFAEVVAALGGAPAQPLHRQVVWELRLPRALVAATAGGMLALAGALLQAVTRNPLAEPGLTGVSAGAVLAAVFWLVVMAPRGDPGPGLPLAALAGGLAAGSASYLLGWRARLDRSRFILMGVLLGGVLASGTTLLLVLSNQSFANLLTWLIGSTNGRTWVHWRQLWPLAAVLIPLGVLSAPVANLLWLGDEVARGLGLRAEVGRLALLVLAVGLTAGAVATVGAVGFVGLIVPHLGRRIVGEDARRLFPVSVVMGSGLLLGADILTQVLVIEPPWRGLSAPAQLPVGIYLALVGVGSFLVLLRREGMR